VDVINVPMLETVVPPRASPKQRDSNKLHAPTRDRRARQDCLLDGGGLRQIVL